MTVAMQYKITRHLVAVAITELRRRGPIYHLLQVMSSSGPQPYDGCTRHEGEHIQVYCEACNELLCTRCLTGHASEHKTIKYVDHLRNRQIDAVAIMRRLKNMSHQIDELQKRFRQNKESFQFGIEKCEEKLTSFKEVHDSMKEWQILNENKLNRKKAVQVQCLEAAQKRNMQSVSIERPKIGIRTKARMINSLRKTVKELTPNLVLSISGATVFAQLESDPVPWSYNQEPTYYSNVPQSSESSDTDSDIYELIESGEKMPQTESEHLLLKPATPVAINSDNYELESGEKKPQAELEHLLLKSATVTPMALEELPKPMEIIESPPPLPPRTWDDYDDVYVSLYSNEVYKDTNTLDTEGKNVGVPLLLQNLVQPPSVLPPPPISSCQNPVLPHNSQEDAYSSIDETKVSSQQEPLLPPPLPPRKKKNEEMMNLDTPIYDNFTDPKTIFLEPTDIILSSFIAANPSESVELHDVCTAPLGSMIFTDPENSCLRILMSTDGKAHKMMRKLKGQLQAIAYDQSNTRILIASERCLYQLDFNESASKQTSRNVKLLVHIKDTMPVCLTSTKASYKREEILIYASTRPSSDQSSETSIHCFQQNGQFNTKLEIESQPCGIDYKDGYLVVTSLQDKNLHKIKTNGYPIWKKNVDARQKGVLHNPFRVAILPNDNIAVSETRRQCISVFSKEGQHVLRFGHSGEEPGMFNQLAGIAVRLDKELVVVDAGNKRVQLFALDKLNEQFEIAVAEKETHEVEIAVAEKAVADKESQEAVDKSKNIYDEVAGNELEVEV